MTRLAVSLNRRGADVPVGTAYVSVQRGAVSTTFRYEDSYLALRNSYAIDPALPLTAGSHHTAGLPGCFADCAPDRWGRNLIRKSLLQQALSHHRTPPTITDRDYLVGVSDVTRHGALRFRDMGAGPDSAFLAPGSIVPKLIELPALLHAAAAADDPGDFSAIKTLLDAGSGSLGGARPKASMREGDELLMAKFPHQHDESDVIAWEKTALDLAQLGGIQVPDNRVVTVGGKKVLLLHRFDRSGDERVGYLSAMSLLQAKDGEPHDYCEVAESLTEWGHTPQDDLAQLWRRIAFNIAIHNTDDHLRNIGFLRQSGGWQLAPAFDLNPNPNAAAARVTSIGGGAGGIEEISGLRTYLSDFGLTPQAGHDIIAEVISGVQQWESVASRHGISESEQRRFAPIFADRCEQLAQVFQ